MALLCCLMSAQSVKAQYERHYALPGNTAKVEQQATPSIVSGATTDFTVQTVTIGGQTDILVSSVNKAGGNVVWSRRYGTNNFDEVGYSMVQGLPGTLIIVGHRNEPGGQVDNYVLCINQAGGAILWDLQFGNDGRYESSRLIIDAKGVASTNAFVVAGVTHTNNINNLVPMTYAIDGWGNLIWHAAYGDGVTPPLFQYYEPTSLMMNEQLEVIIAGHVHNAGEKTSLFTMGINTVDGGLLPTGLIYYDILGDLGEEQFPSIIRGANNNGYIMCFNSIFDTGTERIGITHLDNDRDNIWTHLNSITGDPAIQRPVNMILNGVFYEMSLYLQESLTSTIGNPGLLKVQINGAFNDGYRYDIACNNTMDMWRDFNGEYVGESTIASPTNVFTMFRTDVSGPIDGCGGAIPDMQVFTIPNPSFDHPMDENLDYEIDEIDPVYVPVNQPLVFQEACATAFKTSVEDAEKELVTLYPNPSHGQFTLSIGQTIEDGSVQIVDPLGRVVLEHKLSSGNIQVDLSGEAKGFYSVLIYIGNEVQTQKLIIE